MRPYSNQYTDLNIHGVSIWISSSIYLENFNLIDSIMRISIHTTNINKIQINIANKVFG